jgi:hypothetical protein
MVGRVKAMPVFQVSLPRIQPAIAVAAFWAIVVAAAGCGGRSLDGMGGRDGGAGVSGGGGTRAGGTGGTPGPFVPTRAVDVLFMIDDSSGMSLAHQNLMRTFPTFTTALAALPGGLPDIHIAVISSDMGAGDGSISGCAGEGKAGIFQYTARGACTATTLTPSATFISNVGGVANYSGMELADVFTCIAALGQSGCGFEHPLAAIVRALGADGRPAPAENQGFLRPEAFLFLVLLTDEDDCSGPPSLYDTATNLTLSSALGPPANFRCNEFGHLCAGSKPPRRAPNGNVTDTVTLAGCVPAEASGMLTPVATFVSQLRAVKPFPDQQIVVSAISGPATPYAVHWKAPSLADTGPWPEITHACVAADLSFADPAVRITAFVNAFGANGMAFGICDQSFAPALQRIAERIGEVTSQAP